MLALVSSSLLSPPAWAQEPTQNRVDDRWNSWENRWFTTDFNLLLIYDFAGIDQDEASREQVGDVPNEQAWRATRLMLSGQLKFTRPWIYILSVNFNGREADNEEAWGWLDFRVEIPFGETGRLKIGKQKVFLSQEWLMPGLDMVLMERSTADASFIPQRNIGISAAGNFHGRRGAWSAGWFNDWFSRDLGFSDNGNTFDARLSYLPIEREDSESVLQVALGVYFREATNGTMQFRSRPEVNEFDYFIDTGSIPAEHALSTQVEMTAQRGPAMLFGSVTATPVSTREAGDPFFIGWYVGSSYVLTGERRAFQYRDGYYGRVVPSRPVGDDGIGAWELGVRYSDTDLASGNVDGGRLSRWTGALSWYPNARWRVEFNYGYMVEDKAGITGYSHSYSARLQWVLF